MRHIARLTATCILMLAGCATPQPALDAANHTASLIGQMQQEVTEFRRVQNMIVNQRTALLRTQAAAIARAQSRAAADVRAREAAGDRASITIYERLRAQADAHAGDEEALNVTLAESEERLSHLIKPLTDPTTSLIDAEKAMVLMGTELSFATRRAELKQWVDAVRKDTNKNRDEIQQMEADAAKKTAETAK